MPSLLTGSTQALHALRGNGFGIPLPLRSRCPAPAPPRLPFFAEIFSPKVFFFSFFFSFIGFRKPPIRTGFALVPDLKDLSSLSLTAADVKRRQLFVLKL